jgi:hypothetical protein
VDRDEAHAGVPRLGVLQRLLQREAKEGRAARVALADAARRRDGGRAGRLAHAEQEQARWLLINPLRVARKRRPALRHCDDHRDTLLNALLMSRPQVTQSGSAAWPATCAPLGTLTPCWRGASMRPAPGQAAAAHTVARRSHASPRAMGRSPPGRRPPAGLTRPIEGAVGQRRHARQLAHDGDVDEAKDSIERRRFVRRRGADVLVHPAAEAGRRALREASERAREPSGGDDGRSRRGVEPDGRRCRRVKGTHLLHGGGGVRKGKGFQHTGRTADAAEREVPVGARQRDAAWRSIEPRDAPCSPRGR